MKVCLIRLPSPYLTNEKTFPPLGLLSVATALRNDGHDVIVHDGDMNSIPTGFDGYGMGPSITEYGDAKKVLEMIKATAPYSRVVAGGPHPTLNAGDCIDDGFDCVVSGDGESLADLAFTSDNVHIFVDPEPPLDSYDIIDRSFINIRSYEYFIDGAPATPVVTAKGCPYKCGFCSKVYNSVRMRSADHVGGELDYLHFDLGYNAVMFFDDTFILDPGRVETIALHLLKLGMKWRCLVRGDLIVKHGRDFIRMMRSAGCVEVGMGIESGSEKILSAIHKGETVSIIRRAISLLKSEGVRVKGFFILGLPGEDETTLEETDRFVREVGLNDMDFSLFKPYAGSPIYRNPKAYDIQWDDMDYANTYYKGNGREVGGNIRTSALSNARIVGAMYRMEAEHKSACQ